MRHLQDFLLASIVNDCLLMRMDHLSLVSLKQLLTKKKKRNSKKTLKMSKAEKDLKLSLLCTSI